jgi:hypothetical protein
MLPKKGKKFSNRNGEGSAPLGYARAIATALRAELGGSHQAMKTVMRWTDACERTAKNWIAGTRGPAGEHLILLLRNSKGGLRGSAAASWARVFSGGFQPGQRKNKIGRGPDKIR